MIKRDFNVDGISFYLYDLDFSKTAEYCDDHFKVNFYGIKDVELKKGSCFLDLGANIGSISLYIAKKFPETTVVAVEALKESYDLMKQAADEQGIKNIIFINAAIAATNRPVIISAGRGLSGAAKEYKTEVHPDYRLYETSFDQAMTMSQLLDYAPNKFFDLVKMNIEGAEYEIFESLSDSFLISSLGNIVAELHMIGSMGSLEQKLEQRLKSIYPKANLHFA